LGIQIPQNTRVEVLIFIFWKKVSKKGKVGLCFACQFLFIFHNKGQRVFKIVSKIKFVFEKKTKDKKTTKDVKPTLRATFKKKVYFFEYLP
jgi:hypothetical protein